MPEIVLANDFPPGLNTAAPATEIAPNETPDGYGYDLARDGLLVQGAIPSGTARVATAISISGNDYYYHYDRLWRANGTALEYYARFYNDVLVKQRLAKIVFSEDAQSVLVFIPFGQDSMFVGKSTGAYVLSNCADGRAFFQRTGMIQEMAVSAATRAIKLDGLIFASNANGLFGFQGGATQELTRKVRDGLTDFADKALVADYSKKRIIGGTTFVYELETQKIYRYSGSNFRYTSRQMRLPDDETFAVNDMRVSVEYNDDDDGYFVYQVRIEDNEWGLEHTVNCVNDLGEQTNILETLDGEDGRRTRRWQMRITEMSSNLAIREIHVSSEEFGVDTEGG